MLYFAFSRMIGQRFVVGAGCTLAEELRHRASLAGHVASVDARHVTKAVPRLTIGEAHQKIRGPEFASRDRVAAVSRTPLDPLLVAFLGSELDDLGFVVQEIGAEPIEHDIERRSLCLADPDKSRSDDECRQRRLCRSMSWHVVGMPR